MTEPTRHEADDERSDESRDISDVGLPHPGDDTGPAGTASTAGAAGTDDAQADEAALDEVFPPAGS